MITHHTFQKEWSIITVRRDGKNNMWRIDLYFNEETEDARRGCLAQSKSYMQVKHVFDFLTTLPPVVWFMAVCSLNTENQKENPYVLPFTLL